MWFTCQDVLHTFWKEVSYKCLLRSEINEVRVPIQEQIQKEQ